MRGVSGKREHDGYQQSNAILGWQLPTDSAVSRESKQQTFSASTQPNGGEDHPVSKFIKHNEGPAAYQMVKGLPGMAEEPRVELRGDSEESCRKHSVFPCITNWFALRIQWGWKWRDFFFSLFTGNDCR